MQKKRIFWSFVGGMAALSLAVFVFMGCGDGKVEISATSDGYEDQVIIVEDEPTTDEDKEKLNIYQVLGNGSNPDRIGDGIIIKGEGFGYFPVVLLLSRVSKTILYTLTVDSANAEEIHASLPPDIEEGEYTVRVKNASLSDEREVTILKGEKGDKGDKGDTGATGAQGPAGGGGDITSVNAGTGLTGGSESGDVNLDVDTTVIQKRVTSTCTAGSSIRVIDENGAVTCETDDTGGGGGSSVWSLSGDDVYRSAGKVGIGTTEPVGQLHISGNEAVGDGEGGVAVIISNAGNGSAVLGFGSDSRKWNQVVGGTGTGDFSGKFGIYDITEDKFSFVIDTSGNVGIGTTGPTVALQIGDPINAKELKIKNISSTSGAVDFSSPIWMGSSYVAGTNFMVSGGTGVTYFNSGNVGIGTTSPQGALEVASTTGGFIVPRMTTAQRDALTPVNGMIIYNTTTNQFNFYENGAWVIK